MNAATTTPKGGAKMPRAKLQLVPDEMIEAVEYDKDKQGPVVCVDCRCQVRHVSTYTRNVGDEQITVLAYFRLAPGVDHGPKCRYNVEKTIKHFVAYSRSVENTDADALPILDKIGRGQAAEFRLHVLMDAIQVATGHPPSRSRVKYIRRREDDEGTGTDYIPTNRVLRPYFRTAKGILLLAARIQDHSDLAAWVTLKFGDQVIHWDEFFFHLEQYADLYESLALDQRRRKASIYTRPVSIVAQIASDRRPYLTENEWRVNGKFQVIKTNDGKELAVRPVMYCSDKGLADRLAEESFVLLCGIPRIGRIKPRRSLAFRDQVDISMTVANPGQFCRYSPT